MIKYYSFMGNIKIVEGGVCSECGHQQQYHEGNNVCDVEGCDCTVQGSYWWTLAYQCTLPAWLSDVVEFVEDNLISDQEFANCVLWLIDKGVIICQEFQKL